MSIFVDSNIPMYVAGTDHPHKEAARRFLDRVLSGRIAACTSTEVLQEILPPVFFARPAGHGPGCIQSVCRYLSRVLDVTLADTDRARDLLCVHPRITSRDAVHAAVMLNHRLERIATFDAGFDGIPGIERVELT